MAPMDQNNNKTPHKGANKRNLIISGAVILAVLVALFVVPTLGNKKDVATVPEETGLPEGCKPGYAFSETTGEPCPKTEEETTSVPASSDTLSRADAALKYAGSTVRFSGDCVADPGEMKTAAGTTIMLDNDTDARRTIMVGSKSYSVGARRYTLSWMNMGVGEYAVSCDGKAVSKIVIQ